MDKSKEMGKQIDNDTHKWFEQGSQIIHVINHIWEAIDLRDLKKN